MRSTAIHKARQILSIFPRTCLIAPLLLFGTESASAQGATPDASQGGVVRGTVTSKLLGTTLSHAVVTIEALGLQQFSNDQGKFYFVKVKPGKYQLNVRQLGYLPANTEIVVDGTGAAEVTIQMDRIATKLSAFKVVDRQLCEMPGRPTQADGEQIFEVFEQLEQSAIRLALLAKQFPHLVVYARQLLRHEANGADILEREEMLSRDGQLKVEYEPGQVVKRVGGAYTLQIPTLLDFADKKFLANHCFALRGLEVLPAEAGGDGSALVRIDFTASSTLKNPDVEGSVFLDSSDYRLRRTEIRLSKVPANIPEIANVKVITTFQDYVPGMPVVGLVTALTELKEVKGKPLKVLSRSERQVVSKLLFLKQRPDSVPELRK